MTKHHILLILVTAVLAAWPAKAGNDHSAVDSLRRGFAEPPREARPLVWWHWMNGNITADGLRKDMMWMHRSGIAGFHVFDANFSTPQIVDRRIEYMSAEWKQIFGDMLRTADSLGMEVSIASSPGFSATGGPWVKPEDAMKKIVWRELLLEGGAHFKGPLPEPYTVTGQFQDLEYALFLYGRCKHDREIHERSQTGANGVLVVLHHLGRAVLNQVPLVNHHHKTLLVLDDE